MWKKAVLTLGLSALVIACSGSDQQTTSGDGDGDAAGDGDSTGDGDMAGDGDAAGDGDSNGDGDMTGDGDVVTCTGAFIMGLDVLVVGAGPVETARPAPATGGGGGDEPQNGCRALVVAVDGDYQETLSCFPEGADCRCSGAGERPGTYLVTATMGNLSEEQEVTVTSDECHVKTESLTFFDDPSPLDDLNQ